MGGALHPIARQRIKAAVEELRGLVVAEFPEELNNGPTYPTELARLGELVRAQGEAIVKAASALQVRVDAVIDDQTCATCRAADSSHHLLEGNTMSPPFHRCEHIAEGGICRCKVTLA